MFETATIAAILAIFLLAGTVKGVIGLGLPTVSLALLTVALDLTSAMALLLVPSLVTNLWQAFAGGHLRSVLRRVWPFLLAATLTIWLGALALTRVDLALLSGLLGAVLVVYAGASFKAAGKPEAGPKESFAEAIRRSFMPAGEKDRWLKRRAGGADPD